jgi:hypothetical protein
MVLQNKAQKVADKLNEEVIFITKGVQHIQVQAGTACLPCFSNVKSHHNNCAKITNLILSESYKDSIV